MKLKNHIRRRLQANGGYFGHGIADPETAPTISPDRITHVHPEDFEMFLRDGPHGAPITFDDGYADNLTTALPLLEKYARPATVFVTTGFVERTRPLLARVAAAVARSGDWQRPSAARFLGGDIDSAAAAYEGLRTGLKRLGAADLWQAQQQILAEYALDVTTLTDDYLTLEQLRALDAHPLITIGAHTHSHPDLRHCTAAELWHELDGARRQLAQWLGHPVTTLAYPFGDTDWRVRRAARHAGYRRAYVTEAANWRSRLPGYARLDITRIDLSGEVRRMHRRRLKRPGKTSR